MLLVKKTVTIASPIGRASFRAGQGAEREGCGTGGATVEEHGKKGHGDPASRPKLEDLSTDREYVPQDHDEQQLWEEEESAGKHPPSPPNCHESR